MTIARLRSCEGDPLTPIQAGVLTFLFMSVRVHGYQPNLHEIGAAFGWHSANCARGVLAALAAKGYVAPGTGRPRAVRLLRWPDGRPFRGFAPPEGPQRSPDPCGS